MPSVIVHLDSRLQSDGCSQLPSSAAVTDRAGRRVCKTWYSLAEPSRRISFSAGFVECSKVWLWTDSTASRESCSVCASWALLGAPAAKHPAKGGRNSTVAQMKLTPRGFSCICAQSRGAFEWSGTQWLTLHNDALTMPGIEKLTNSGLVSRTENLSLPQFHYVAELKKHVGWLSKYYFSWSGGEKR